MHNKIRRKGSKTSNFGGRSASSKVWNVNNQQMPLYNGVQKKDNSIHRFIQTTDLNTVVASNTTGPTFFSRSFTLNDITQVSSFQTIFDQYRITEIETWLMPGLSNLNVNVGASNTLYSVIDYDDDASPPSIAALQQYTNCIVTNPSNGHYRRWKPHVAEALYSGAFTSYGNIKAPWIDMASPSVKHYGLKAGMTAAPSTSSIVSLQLIIRVHFECRNVF